MTTVTRHITQAHLDEWVKGSGISEVIARLNLESLDDPEEIAHHLNWRAYKGSPGWWVSGIDPRTGQPRTFGQFKPNEPLQFPDDDPAKYVTGPKGSPTKAFFVNTGDAAYWQRILDNPTKLVAITEGFKKAASGITAGIPTVALAGVWNGQVDKKRLIPDLELIAAPGRPICLIFDSDILTKPEVQQALIHLGRLLNKAGCIVTVAQLPAQIKGMDDFIVAHGSNEFKKLVGDARAYSSWLKGLEGQFSLIESNNGRENKTRKVPPADIVAHEVAEQYKDQMAYNNEVGQWMRYGADFPGIWSLETDEYVEAIIGSILDGKNITGYGSYSYITNVVKTLRRLLIVRRWDERSPSEILPFINGVMDVSSGELLPHSPGYRLTWHLPRNHDPTARDWSGINTYLEHLSGENAAIKDVLLCYCNAVLKGRSDLQKFLHLIGLAGSGKGTFARLLTDLIGSENIYSGTLEDWCGNRFESANAYRKRLVVFWDEDRQTGKLGKFLSLTGGDFLRAEEKGKKAFQYRYDGMVLVCSNLPIFTGDSASRIARRVVTVPCNATVPLGQRRDLNTEFQGELDAFTNHILSIPDAHVTKVLMGLQDIPECTLEFWENRIRTDSIAAWVNDWVIYDCLASTAIGGNKEEGFDSLPSTLYGSYCLHCKQSGTNPKANKNFSPDFLELCRSVLGWEIERKVTKTGKFIKGVRLRTDGDGNYATYDYQLMQRVTGACGSGDGLGDGLECLQVKDYSKCDWSTETSIENLEVEKDFKNKQTKLDFPKEFENDESLQVDFPPGKDSDPYASSVTAPVTLPITALEPTQPQQSPAPVTEVDVELAEATALTPRHKPPVFRVGDRCRYCGPEGAMAVTCRGKELKVLNTRINDQGEQDARVKAPPWCTSYWVTSRHLKLKLGDCHE